MRLWILLALAVTNVTSFYWQCTQFSARVVKRPDSVLHVIQSSNMEESLGLEESQLTELSGFLTEFTEASNVTDINVAQSKVSGAFVLPDLREFVERETQTSRSERRRAARSANKVDGGRSGGKKINRKNLKEYQKALELDPFADSDEGKFVEEYDIFQSILGQGSIIGIPIQYLQSGHLMLILLSLLSAFAYDPANPLTNFPPEIRAFLWHGLKIIGAINCVLAVQAYRTARRRNLPAVFWFVKTLLLGGIATYELDNVQVTPIPASRKEQ